MTNSTGTGPVTLKQMAKTRQYIRVLRVKKDLNTAIVDLINAHLNKARAEGIIDDDTRIELLDSFLAEAERLEKDIDKKMLLIRLFELEKTQKNLIHNYQAQIRKLDRDIESVKGTLPLINGELEHSGVAKKSDYPVNTQPKQVTKALRLKRWPSSVKFVLGGGVILALTLLGIRFGMRVFLSLGALLIGSAFLLRVFHD